MNRGDWRLIFEGIKNLRLIQSSRSQIATLKPRKPIGFIQPEENDEDDKEES